MTRARRELVSLDTTAYYHCICRCVRRAFLCGEDHLTGKNYEHRKHWVRERLALLAQVFAIDICAYAIMSNHYHIVTRINQSKADQCSDEQVLRRWKKLFKLPVLVERYQKGLTTCSAEDKKAREIIAQWRERLTDLGWFMRCLNEHLARRANEEDCCTGRFWEGRFKSQALLDEAAVLTCMSYVDLNPIRAGIAKTPEASDFTSIQQRVQRHMKKSTSKRAKPMPIVRLMPLKRQGQDPHPNAIHYSERDYLELVDWAGRVIRDNKRGYIAASVPPLLTRLGIAPEVYLQEMKMQSTTARPVMLGHIDHIKLALLECGKTFIKGMGLSRALYVKPASC